MDDVRNRVTTTRPTCTLTDDDLQNPALTFRGNKNAAHLHKRLSYQAQQKSGIEIRDILAPRLQRSLMAEDDPLYMKIEAWLHGLTPASHLAPPWGGVGAPAVPGVLASSHLLGGTEPPGLCAPVSPHLLRGSGAQRPNAPASSHLLRGTGKPAKNTNVTRSGTGIVKSQLAAKLSNDGLATPNPPPVGADLARRTANLRRRTLVRGAAFPVSLRILRSRCGVTEAGDSWPALLAEEALISLTLLMDEDDALLDIYQRAVMRDCADATIGRHMAVHKALRFLTNPDATIAAMWKADPECASMAMGSKLLLRCGLMPFGAWAAVAASTVHEPGIAPEASSIMQMLDCSSPAPWMGLSSLVRLAAKLTAALDEVKAMGVYIDASIMISPLVNKLATAPDCSEGGAWGELVLKA